MVTRQVLQQVMLRNCTILIMQQREWRQVQLQQQLQEVLLRERILTRVILQYYQADVQDVMAVVVLQVHLRFIQSSHLKAAVQRFRRVMHLQSVRCKDYSEDLRLLSLLRSVMILVQAVYRLLSVNQQMVLRYHLIKYLRSMRVLMEQSLLFQNHRKEWQLCQILRMLNSSLNMRKKRILKLLRQLL